MLRYRAAGKTLTAVETLAVGEVLTLVRIPDRRIVELGEDKRMAELKGGGCFRQMLGTGSEITCWSIIGNLQVARALKREWELALSMIFVCRAKISTCL